MSETSDRDSATKVRNAATGKGGRDRMPELPDASIFPFGPIATDRPAPLQQTGVPVPMTEPLQPASPARPRPGDGMFDKLVANENDVPGLVAYGIYKYSERDWLLAFESAHGRAPEPNEVHSFKLGETTDRRAALYRRLAEDLLAAAYPNPAGAKTRPKPATVAALAERYPEPEAAPRFPMTRATARGVGFGRKRPSWAVAAYLAFLVLFLVALVVLVRTGSLPFSLGSH